MDNNGDANRARRLVQRLLEPDDLCEAALMELAKAIVNADDQDLVLQAALKEVGRILTAQRAVDETCLSLLDDIDI